MSTAGRINKSTTKFVPKRKNPSTASAQRASSATPSISSSTPRVTATRAESVLPTTEEFNLGDDESSSATAAAATDPPVERTNTVDLSSVAPVAAVSTVRGASFAPSDPSQSQRQTQTQASSSQSQPPSSLGLSFGPQDPSLSSQATTVFANSQDERRAPGLSRSPSRKTQGTAFGVSSTAPSVRQPASAAPSSVPPASPSPRIAPQPSSSNASGRTALDSLAAAARVAAHVERQTENDGDSETGHAPADDDDDNADEHDDAPPAKRSRVARNKAKGKEKEAESTMQEKAEAARQKRLENKAKRDAKNKGKAAALASALAPASSVVGRARIIDLEPGPEAGPSSRNEQSNGEGAASERQLVEGAERVQQLPPPKRKRGRPRKTPIAAEDAAAEQNDEAGPASIAANSSSNQRAPVVKSAKAKGKQKDVDAGEDDDDDKSDAEPQKPVSKRRRAAEAARAKTNNWLFNSSSDDDSDAFEPEGAARKDGGAADGDDAGMDDELSTEGEDRVGANGRVFKGKGKGKGGKGTRKGGRKQPAEIVVDSSTTLMADIATALDLVAGRESTRGPKLAKKLEERAQRQKEARERTKRHRQRRAEGLNSETEEDEHEREQEGAIDDGAENGAAPEVAGTHAPASEGSPAPAAIAQDDDEAAPANGFEDLIRRQNDGEEGSGPGSDEDEDEAEIEEAQPDADADTEAGGGDDYSGLKETRAPQMRLVGDRLVIDEDSLEIDRVADAARAFVGDREVRYENQEDKLVNSATWGKRRPTERWDQNDTDLFYDGVRQFGTDFEMIAGLFPYRSRRMIKKKWNKEDRLHPHLITAALMRKKPIDLELYAKITKQDLSGPVPEDPMDKINQMRAEQAAEELANGGPLPAKVKKRSASAVELRGGGEEEGADDVQSALERVDEEMGDGGEDEEEDEDAEARLAEEEARQAEVDAEIAAAEAAEAAA